MKRGFTLTELLVAVTVVGFVAALTVPALIEKYQKNMQVTALKKVYTDFQKTLTILESENIYGNLTKSRLADSDKIDDFIKENYRVKIENYEFPSTYKCLDSNCTTESISDNAYSVLLNDGVAMAIVPATNNTPAIVYVDVNGPDKPNIGGRDMFTFQINDDYTIDEKYGNETIDTTKARCGKNTIGTGCFQKIIDEDWKMNY